MEVFASDQKSAKKWAMSWPGSQNPTNITQVTDPSPILLDGITRHEHK